MNILAIKRISAGLSVIALLSLILLIIPSGNSSKDDKTFRIASFIFSSRETLADTEKGYLEALRERGYIDGKNIRITRYNAENDMPTANTIAKEIVTRDYDIVLTASTPALQVMANANKEGKLIHVFGAVTDPFASGVGLSRGNPPIQPPHLTGAGTFQPVKKLLIIAKQMNPGLKSLGVVWCRSETCSEACVNIARPVCDSLGIKLIEATVDNTTAVLEAAQSIVARGVDAIWIGGDNVVEMSIAMVIKAADAGGIPVFTNNVDHVKVGSFFSLGANYVDVGKTIGNIAADILEGKKPSEIPVENIVPEKLVVNEALIGKFSKNWKVNN